LPYADVGLPVPLAVFCRYGLAFQQQAVPALEQKMVTRLANSARGFTLTVDDGTTVKAQRVVVAVGISHFSHVPSWLPSLPPELASHSSAHVEVGRFKGREVVVVGGGASAVDIAALLHEAGAGVRLVIRRPRLEMNASIDWPRPLTDRLREPMSPLGPSWHSWFFANMPLAFHRLPQARRIKWARTQFGPAAGWFMANRVFGKFPLIAGRTVIDARVKGDRVELHTEGNDGSSETLEADHVIAATGYRPSLRRLAFIAPEVAGAIDSVQEMPVLSSKFESSVPGLHFVGPIAVNSFGPLMRFACAAKFTARRLSDHLAAQARAADQVRNGRSLDRYDGLARGADGVAPHERD
jgi:thioredoxin reductase